MSASEYETIDSVCPHGDDHHEPPALEFYSGFDAMDDEHKGVLYDPANPDTYIEMSVWATLDVEAMA